MQIYQVFSKQHLLDTQDVIFFSFFFLGLLNAYSLKMKIK